MNKTGYLYKILFKLENLLNIPSIDYDIFCDEELIIDQISENCLDIIYDYSLFIDKNINILCIDLLDKNKYENIILCANILISLNLEQYDIS